MVAGTKYAIVVTEEPSGGNPVNSWDGSCNNNYGPGAALVLNGAAWMTIPAYTAGGNGEGDCIQDFAFRTFVTVAAPVETPPPTAPPTAAPTLAPTPPPTSTGGSTSGDSPSNLSYLLTFAGLAAVAVAFAFASNTRRRLVRR